MLKLNNISKNYKNVEALKDTTLSFSDGIYGLIGPNGAGKSTLINLIATIIKPSQGSIFYNEKNIYALKKEYRKLIGLMPQNQTGFEDFTGYAFLFYMAALKNIEKSVAKIQIDKLIKQVSLSDSIHRKVKTYSGGMRQRLMFAQALLGNPKIVILDEPTAGLDPFERIKMRNYISEISKDRIVIVATHVMQDIEAIVDEIILIKNGEILAKEKPIELISSVNGYVYKQKIPYEKLAFYNDKYIISQVIKTNEELILRYINKEEFKCKHYVLANLEEVYLYYMV